MLKKYFYITLLNLKNNNIKATSENKFNSIFVLKDLDKNKILDDLINLIYDGEENKEKKSEELKAILNKDYKKFIELLEIYYEIFEKNKDSNEDFYIAEIEREKKFAEELKKNNLEITPLEKLEMFLFVPLLDIYYKKKNIIFAIDEKQNILKKVEYKSNLSLIKKIIYIIYISNKLQVFITQNPISESKTKLLIEYISKVTGKINEEMILKEEIITLESVKNKITQFKTKEIKEKYKKLVEEGINEFSSEEQNVILGNDNIYQVIEVVENILTIFSNVDFKDDNNSNYLIFLELAKLKLNNKLLANEIILNGLGENIFMFKVMNFKKENNEYYFYNFSNKTAIKSKIDFNSMKDTLVVHMSLSILLMLMYNQKLCGVNQLRLQKLIASVNSLRIKAFTLPNAFVEVKKTTF